MSEVRLIDALKGQNVWVAGAGRSGLGAARLLKSAGLSVFVSDNGSISEMTKKQLSGWGIGFEELAHDVERFKREAQALVVSPGIPQDKGLALEARKLGRPLLSEIEICSWFLQPTQKVVGITGTNGKSTVTNYLAHLFQSSNLKSIACGNIGVPFSEVIESDLQFFALELSSYQLETTFNLKLDAAVILNIQNDHLARYKTLTEYLKAKWRILEFLKPKSTAVIGIDVLEKAVELGLFFRNDIQFIVVDELHRTRPRKINPALPCVQPFMRYGSLLDVPIENIVHLKNISYMQPTLGEDGRLHTDILASHGSHSIAVEVPCLPGLHNVANLAAASAVSLALGLTAEVVQREWNKATSSYKQLAHRLEQVGTDETCFVDSLGRPKTVRIFNDSKATNVESTLVAVKSFKSPVRILLGGEPKGDSYLPLASFMGHPLVAIYPFGKAASLICEHLKGVPGICQPAKTLLAAATQALTDCNEGDTILLSPACASFDEFKNFEHRGDVFKSWALGHALNPS